MLLKNHIFWQVCHTEFVTYQDWFKDREHSNAVSHHFLQDINFLMTFSILRISLGSLNLQVHLCVLKSAFKNKTHFTASCL
jgi:hypothetical protein